MSVQISIAGVNHKSAPVHLRERVSLTTSATQALLDGLKYRFGSAEFVVLATCNRVEIYAAGPESALPQRHEMVRILAEAGNVEVELLDNAAYHYQGMHAVRHLLCVASSLDSMVVGEVQIVAQVKEAYRLACAAGTSGKVLNRLFHHAFATSKNVLSLTSIAQRRVSVAGVAIEQAVQELGSLERVQACMLGTGQMGELLLKHLIEKNCREIVVFSRSCPRGQAVAERYRVRSAAWKELPEHFVQADLIVASAMAEEHLFDDGAFQQVIEARQGRKLLIVDIAVPRNFAANVGDLDGVTLLCIDDLGRLAHENLQARQEDVEQARDIVRQAGEDFFDWLSIMEIGPLVGELKQRLLALSRHELDRALRDGPDLDQEQTDKARRTVHQVMSKMAHQLIEEVNDVARDQGVDSAQRMLEGLVREQLDRMQTDPDSNPST